MDLENCIVNFVFCHCFWIVVWSTQMQIFLSDFGEYDVKSFASFVELGIQQKKMLKKKILFNTVWGKIVCLEIHCSLLTTWTLCKYVCGVDTGRWRQSTVGIC